MIVRASGHRTLTTHLFDASSDHLDSDAVFAVKPSLLRTFTPRAPDDPRRPDGITGPWLSVESDFVLTPGQPGEPRDPGRTA
jgi:catechol 1,2-dioxygenase